MIAWPWLVVSLLGLLASAICACVQFAISEASRGRLDELAEDKGARGDVLKRRARAIMDDASGHRVAVALPRVVLNGAVLVAGAVYAGLLAGHDSPDWADALIGAGAGALAIWAVGVAVPMSIAEHTPERVVLSASGLVRAWYLVLTPARRVLGVFDEGVRRLSGAAEQTPVEQLEQELRDVVDDYNFRDELGEEEREMIEAVVDFRTTTVEQIMTPRTEIRAIEYTDDLSRVKAAVSELGHSRVPVYEQGLDTIVGFLYAKDLLRWIITHHDGAGNGKPFVLREVLRPVTFVPEAKTVRELLTELLAQRVHIAMVADEYGGTAGLVTIEDIVEEIFGEIADEYEEPEPEQPVVLFEEARAAVIDARHHIDDTNDELEPIRLELPESDDYDTVGGFVVTTLGRIPTAGEMFEHEGVRLEVLEAEATRVVRVRVEAAPEPDEQQPTRDPEGTDAAADRAEAG